MRQGEREGRGGRGEEKEARRERDLFLCLKIHRNLLHLW